MKAFISVDMEGVVGTTTWSECEKGDKPYEEFRRRMAREAAEACRGALAAGATEILVRDAHDSDANIPIDALPAPTRLLRGKTGHPFQMMSGIDETFDAAAFVGYHARAGSDANPLAHTMTLRTRLIELNGEPLSEFRLNALTAASVGVPVVFASGDEFVCEEARAFDPKIRVAPVKRGFGAATLNLHPDEADALIREQAREAFRNAGDVAPATLPDEFEIKFRFVDKWRAYRYSFYPGAKLEDAETVAFATDDWFDVVRIVMFLT
jgi:D-amino peptidase